MNILSRLYDSIQDHYWIVLCFSVVIMVIYVPVLWRAAMATLSGPAPAARAVPGPSGKPATTPARYRASPPALGKQEVLPTAYAANSPAGAARANAPAPTAPAVTIPESTLSNAKTLKLPTLPSKSTHGEAAASEALSERAKHPGATSGPTIPLTSPEAEPTDQAFDGLSTSGESPSHAVRRKASRMEELGLHPGSHDGHHDAVLGAPGPRNETAELTSILERIDKFLADDPADTTGSSQTAHSPGTEHLPSTQAPEAPTASPLIPTAPAAKPADPVDPSHLTAETLAIVQPKADAGAKKAPPLWARADALDEDAAHPAKPTDATGGNAKPGGDTSAGKPSDPGQQRLF